MPNGLIDASHSSVSDRQAMFDAFMQDFIQTILSEADPTDEFDDVPVSEDKTPIPTEEAGFVN